MAHESGDPLRLVILCEVHAQRSGLGNLCGKLHQPPRSLEGADAGVEVCSLTERFGDAVVVYRSKDELRETIDRLLEDPADCRRRADLGRAVVLDGHTFAHRVDELVAAVEEHVGAGANARRLRAA